MRKLLKHHSLAHSMSSEICLEAETLNARNLDLEDRQGRARFGLLKDHVGSSSHQDVVDCLNAVLWCLYFGQVDWLHDAWRGQQERTVSYSARSWDNLTRTPEDRFIGELTTKELELAVLELLLAEWSLSCRPLEPMDDWSF